MNQHSASYTFSVNEVSLCVFAVSLQGEKIPPYVGEAVQQAFSELAQYLKDSTQVLYMRDIKSLTIANTYPGGNCYNQSEAMIAVPNWKVEREQLVATINHELHHMARWQNAGYGDTLGGAILSEGIATFYEELRSGWSPPWAQVPVTAQHAQKALQEWDNTDYNHAQWFFEGKQDKWIGYALGARLAHTLYKDGFDLKASLTITPAQAKEAFEALTF